MTKYAEGSITNSLVAADLIVRELTAYRAEQIEGGKLSPTERAQLDRTLLQALRERDTRAAELDRLQAQQERTSLLATLYGHRPKLTQAPQRPATPPGGPGPTPNPSSAPGP